MAAGLDASRFWQITLRLVAIELEGADLRLQRERELVWLGAMLPWLKNPIPLDEFAGRKLSQAERVAKFHKGWDEIDKALRRAP